MEAMRGTAYCLVSHGLLSLLSYRPQGHQPRDGSIYNELDPPPLRRCLTAGTHGGIPSLEAPFSLVTLAGVQ